MSLIDSLKNEINSTDINQIGEKLGLSNIQTSSALNVAIPAVLASFLKNKGSSFDALKDKFSSTLSNPSAFNQATDSTASNSLINGLFGGDSSSIIQSIANKLGIGADKSTSLLASVIPFITAGITRLIANKGWSMPDFMGKILENKHEISSALPADLSNRFGLANITSAATDFSHASKTPLERNNPVQPTNVKNYDHINKMNDDVPKSTSFTPWLLGIIAVGIILWLLLGKGCNEEKVAVVADSVANKVDMAVEDVKGSLNEAGDYIWNLGETITRKLPNGNELKIGANSVENKLIDFIEDKNRAVDKDTWFTFDRLYFETGKSTLKAESREQLNNIAAIMMAYPNVHLKLGGYTDNTGDAATNKQLSEERAKVAEKTLEDLGIDGDRLDAEGYGQEHPVADNTTVEGRAQNRRIDIRVTKK